MNTRIKSILVLAVVFTVVTGMITLDKAREEHMATINLKIEKSDDDTWRVKDPSSNANRGTVVARRMDNIFYQARGSAMVFNIPNVKTYFNVPDGMFQDGFSQRIEDNSMLRLDVRSDAPQDSIVYNVFVVSEGVYVVGNSPPVLIIR